LVSIVSRRTRIHRAAALLAAVAAALALAAPASASSSASASSATLARRGIAAAVKRGWLKQPDAQRYRAAVYLAEYGIRFLPKLRGRVLAEQLAQVSAIWDSYTSPRALALFSQLEENVAYLDTHRVPSSTTDVTGPDGVVYRWFPGLGLEFHPLANFAQLNNLASAKNAEATQTLADALVARAIPRGGSLLWEYAFPEGAGRPPWASGLAQAVAAQALSRAGVLLGDNTLLAAAARAYAAIPGKLDLATPAGPWIRLYGFDHEVVLNAQLQAILSLAEYGTTTGDTRATSLSQEMTTAARTLFPRFDTGDWSRYELGGGYAKTSYQIFVTTLLGKLAKQTEDPFWQDAAARFTNYTYQPPQVTQPDPPPALLVVPQPLDGWLDTASIPITLSKRASLTLAVAGKVLTWSTLSRGAHMLTWKPGPGVMPGTYPVTVEATDFTGKHATYHLAPITVAWDTLPPAVVAQVDPTTSILSWQGTDPGTPWLELKLDLSDPAGVQPPQQIDLGHQAVSGTYQLVVPAGTWNAALEATNSAGFTTTVALTALTGAAAAAPPPAPAPAPAP
jgi:D-glucuronyl C5-epimerase C-terminus